MSNIDHAIATFAKLSQSDLDNFFEAVKKEKDRQHREREEADRGLPHKQPSSKNFVRHNHRHRSLIDLRQQPTHQDTLPHSTSDTTTVPRNPMFTIHLSHYLPGVPEFDLPFPHQALTDTFGQLPSPGSTPEPFAEQDGVGLAAAMGNPVAVDVVMRHYGRTGFYTSN
ncbi:hypothetical protein D9615_003059 [Tricholomella constricta]|uniref:Uncharacterized protein n=1 Tax=Tricholomella constricta TaxID=117010 RepID=A0A8H5HG66_9AGAR|nr:hypothetical protein D9615_003059 [Tricholomella constricta]